MNSFTFSIPQNIIVERGSLARLPEVVKELNLKHAFIISDALLSKMGIVSKCKNSLEKAGYLVDEFTDVEGNPSVETVEKATEYFKQCKADFVIAIGGGSSMDVAKAVGVIAKYGGCITEYEGGGLGPGEIIPVVAIPTTAGTGSEVPPVTVITDHSRDYKLTVFSYKLLPAYAILDSELISTVPSSVAAACGIDAMIHAIEAYISLAASSFSDAMAEKALELIGANIRKYVANRKNSKAAEAMLVGSMFAGIAFAWARLGNVHAMSHPVSAYFNVPHGVANAVILPTVMEYNALADNGKYLKIYNYLSTKKALESEFVPEMLVEKIRCLNQELGIPENLRQVGVTEDKLEVMTEDAMISGNVAVNPRMTTRNDILKLYQKAF